MITFPCQIEETPIGSVARASAAVRIRKQPPKAISATRHRSTPTREAVATQPEWIALDFLVNPGFDVTLLPKQVGASLLLRQEPGDKAVELPWRGSKIKALLKTVTMEIEEEHPFTATIAWALETDDVPLVLGQLDVFSKVYDVDFSIVKGMVRFSMQGSEYDQILQRLNEVSPRLKKFQVYDPSQQSTMQFIDVDSVCFIQRFKPDPPKPKRGKQPAVPDTSPRIGTKFTTADGKEYFSEIGLWQLDEMLQDNPSWFNSHKSVRINLRRIMKIKRGSEREILFEGQTDFRDDLVAKDNVPELKRRCRVIV